DEHRVARITLAEDHRPARRVKVVPLDGRRRLRAAHEQRMLQPAAGRQPDGPVDTEVPRRRTGPVGACSVAARGLLRRTARSRWISGSARSVAATPRSMNAWGL